MTMDKHTERLDEKRPFNDFVYENGEPVDVEAIVIDNTGAVVARGFDSHTAAKQWLAEHGINGLVHYDVAALYEGETKQQLEH